jgi:hypothetical protein
MHTQIGRAIATGSSTAGVEGWLGDLSRCDERLAIQRFFAEFMLLFCIYGLNSHKTAKIRHFLILLI